MAKFGPKPKPRGTLAETDIPPWDCMRCKKTLPVSAYYQHSGAAYGYAKKCKTCHSEATKEYRTQKGAEHFRYHKLLKNFNIDRAAFETMLRNQGGVCAVCLGSEPGGHGWWHMDHDHACCPENGRSCGRCVRGILCHSCNLMLGHAKDRKETLVRAIQYLGGE